MLFHRRNAAVHAFSLRLVQVRWAPGAV